MYIIIHNNDFEYNNKTAHGRTGVVNSYAAMRPKLLNVRVKLPPPYFTVFLRIGSGDGSCGGADDCAAGGDVGDDCGSGSDDGPRSDAYAGNDCGAGAYPCALTDADVAAQGGTGGEVGVVAYVALVVDRGAGVDDAVAADCCPGFDDGTGHDDASDSDGGRGGEYGRGVDGGGGDASGGNTSGYVPADAVRADADDELSRQAVACFVTHGHATAGSDGGVVVDNGGDCQSAGVQDVGYDQGMAAGAV